MSDYVDARAREALVNWLDANASPLSLDRHSIVVEPVLNPTGWLENPAFSVESAGRRLHAKLARRGRWPDTSLRRTFDLRSMLEPKYRMPHVVAWIESEGYVGLLSDSVGKRGADKTLLVDLVAFLDGLHADHELALEISDDDCAESLEEAFIDLWIDRFVSDLDEVEAAQAWPPFVDSTLVTWMRREVDSLASLAGAPAFDAPAVSPVHGDLHFDNVLVDGPGTWWVIDWDDLHVGDPAVDFSILLADLILEGDMHSEVPSLLGPRDEAFGMRFALSCRTVLLDKVIDTLADWAAAPPGPVGDAIRDENAEDHRRGLVTYRVRYGSHAPLQP